MRPRANSEVFWGLPIWSDLHCPYAGPWWRAHKGIPVARRFWRSALHSWTSNRTKWRSFNTLHKRWKYRCIWSWFWSRNLRGTKSWPFCLCILQPDTDNKGNPYYSYIINKFTSRLLKLKWGAWTVVAGRKSSKPFNRLPTCNTVGRFWRSYWTPFTLLTENFLNLP